MLFRSVIHSHLLDGIAASVCSLPPFLPASDPRLPDARLGMVLLLHHLESKNFIYRDTQLSRFMTLPLIPHLCRWFRANGSHTLLSQKPAHQTRPLEPDSRRKRFEIEGETTPKSQNCAKRRIYRAGIKRKPGVLPPGDAFLLPCALVTPGLAQVGRDRSRTSLPACACI